MRIFAGDLSLPDFRWLIEHAGWQELPVPSGEDVQGLDVRQWIGKDGVVFSAYPIPRGPGSGVFGTVHLDPAPHWADASGLPCKIDVEELAANLGLKVGTEGVFRLLNGHLGEVRSYLAGKEFARVTLDRHVAHLHMQYELDRDTLRVLRPEIGTLGMIKGLLVSHVLESQHIGRCRRVLKPFARGGGL